VNPTFGSALNFVPPLLLAYLVTFPLFWIRFLVVGEGRAIELHRLPLILYGIAVLIQTIALVPRGGMVRSLCALPLMVMSHLLYGFGFWRGLFTELKPPDQDSDTPVTLENVT
jgi:hypothetical protein